MKIVTFISKALQYLLKFLGKLKIYPMIYNQFYMLESKNNFNHLHIHLSSQNLNNCKVDISITHNSD